MSRTIAVADSDVIVRLTVDFGAVGVAFDPVAAGLHHPAGAVARIEAKARLILLGTQWTCWTSGATRNTTRSDVMSPGS